MHRVTVKGDVLAESDRTIVVAGSHYFPPDSTTREISLESDIHTFCPWKGQAGYYDIHVKGEVNKNAARYYPSTKEAARQIQGYVSLWHGLKGSRTDERTKVDPLS